MFLDLIHSAGLILSLALIYGFILRLWPTASTFSAVLSGSLFGSIAILGMAYPVTIEPGVIFDARTIILPLAGVFGGPVTAVIAGLLAGSYRAWLGGGGAVVGVSVIAMAVACGLVFRHLLQSKRIKANILSLLALGTVVHISEIFLFLFLPEAVVAHVLRSIAIPLIVVFIPATAILGMVFLAIEEQIVTKDELLKLRTDKAEALEKVVDVLSSALESRDPLTSGHEKKVAEITVIIGEKLGYDAHRLEGLRLAASLHDFGNIQIPTDILVKPAALSEPEFNLIKCHPEYGAKLLSDVDFGWPIQEIILQHHERQDGSGYPRGLKNGQIHEEAQIIAVADTLEAMTSHRPFRASLGIETAKAELIAGRGKKYAAQVVDACLELIEDNLIKF
ncbi:LytS/YhcK type 5TM receptor domain-containing protein [Thalassospiraceae bacterium LMO-JJ14]|nr:LytS/YhcK type 5TM receptor domain-containing protein [Thalassospiraceae bacterium LMO-JJ14]